MRVSCMSFPIDAEVTYRKKNLFPNIIFSLQPLQPVISASMVEHVKELKVPLPVTALTSLHLTATPVVRTTHLLH